MRSTFFLYNSTAFFGVLKSFRGDLNTVSTDLGGVILAIGQVLYGYGYVGPFALEYKKTRLTCGIPDYIRVMKAKI